MALLSTCDILSIIKLLDGDFIQFQTRMKSQVQVLSIACDTFLCIWFDQVFYIDCLNINNTPNACIHARTRTHTYTHTHKLNVSYVIKIYSILFPSKYNNIQFYINLVYQYS